MNSLLEENRRLLCGGDKFWTQSTEIVVLIAPNIDVWRKPFEVQGTPMLTNLRMDPFERAVDESIDYNHWWVDHMFMIAPAAGYIGEWLQSFRDFPPRQKPGSFNLDRVMESITKGAGDK